MSSSPLNLQERFGGIDIYLFDQLMKGRIVPGMRVLDAGCGTGRNLAYLLQSGSRRRAMAIDGQGNVARAEARRDILCSPGVKYRD